MERDKLETRQSKQFTIPKTARLKVVVFRNVSDGELKG